MKREVKKCKACGWPQDSFGCFQATKHNYVAREYEPVWNRKEIEDGAVTVDKIKRNTIDAEWIRDHGSPLESLRRGIEQAARGESMDMGSFAQYVESK